MEKNNYKWNIKELLKRKAEINFPEYQREPTVWNLDKKRSLIDSIFRGIDIGTIYLFKNDEGNFDCIDGRQRIGTILSYLCVNEGERTDNCFPVKISNEVYYDTKEELKDLDEKRYIDLDAEFQQIFLSYEINLIIITSVENDLELNLLFLRLQLGQPLNGGEKLKAMTGEMRNMVFTYLRNNPWFDHIKIRQYNRYVRELLAAQIAINYFSKKLTQEYHRCRYIDLQEFFKQNATLDSNKKEMIEEIYSKLSIVDNLFNEKNSLFKNKATTVSAFLFVNKLIEEKRESELNKFKEFFVKLSEIIEAEIPRGIDIDPQYKHIYLKYYVYVTQAADEKYAIENREDFLENLFEQFKRSGSIEQT